jgi:hypothetical protein
LFSDEKGYGCEECATNYIHHIMIPAIHGGKDKESNHGKGQGEEALLKPVGET